MTTEVIYGELAEAFQRFEAAIHVNARGTRFDVGVADFRVVWRKEGGNWGLFVVTATEDVPFASASLAKRLAIAEAAETIVEAALDAATVRRERVRAAIDRLNAASDRLEDLRS